MSDKPRIGRVDLTVADLARSIQFYETVIGLTQLRAGAGEAILGVAGRELLRVVELPGAQPVPRATGLYHFALLLPSRPALALALAHYHQVGAPISGYADHAVSEAIYLTDPDGHGIEVYRDRPRAEWDFPGGALRMTVDPLDIRGILGELPPQAMWSGLPDTTIMGHIHLQVREIAATERFYRDVLGYDIMARYGPAATFLATDGYHHHIGANTWAGAGAPPPPSTAARLLSYDMLLDDAAELEAVSRRLRAAGYEPAAQNGALLISDPSDILIRLRPRP